MNKNDFILFFIIGLILFSGHYLLREQSKYSDERPHSEQISKLINNNIYLESSLTVIPGYHYIISMLCKIFNLKTLNDMRMFTTILYFIFLIPIFYLSTHKNIIKTLQFFFLPIIFVFWFLVYTDLTSLLFILISCMFLKYKKYNFAGLFISLSLYIRQNNLFWMFYIMFVIFIHNNKRWFIEILDLLIQGNTKIFKTLWEYIKIMKVFFIGILFFIIYFLYNGGIVLGSDVKNHPISFHFGNIWFFFFILFLCFLPIMLYRINNVINYVKNNKKYMPMFLGIFLIGLGTFVNTHKYNQYPMFLRNKFLLFFTSNPLYTILFFIIVLYTILCVLTMDYNNKYIKYIFIFNVLYLGLSWLIDVRYYFIAITFFILMKKREKELYIEIYQIIYSIFFSLFMFYGMYQWLIFW